MKTSQVTCKCGALYERTEFHAAPREADRFVCSACGHTLEVFTAANAPRYRLISGPPREPETTITFEPLPIETDDGWRVAATFPDGRIEYVTGFMNEEAAVDWIGSPQYLEWIKARGYQ
jgi:hypothetical protein